MPFKKKGAPDATSLNDPEGVAQRSQKSAGNSGYDISSPDLCYSSGVNPVNKQGQVTNKAGRAMNWPYQKFTVDNELNPRSNIPGTEILSETPTTYGDFSNGGPRGPAGRSNGSSLTSSAVNGPGASGLTG